ncbi:MAG TPA: peptidoglycan-binding domain-containing protein, partial [Candidatus Paceibacterota bacterium]
MSYSKTATTAVVASIVGIAMVAMMFVAAVQTTHAQGVSLSQLVELFISLGIIAPEKAAAARAALGTSVATGSFTADLKMGDSGAEVKALQQALNAKGYTVAVTGAGSAGKETTYFGGLTKAALMRYQTAMAIAATGTVDAATRAKLNGTVAVIPGTVNPGTGTVVPSTGTGISTPGVEGTLSATQTNSGLPSTLYEADVEKGVLGVKLEAKNSDISVQRVKLDLGTDTKIYNKIFKKMYVTDGTTVYATSDVNSSTVVKDSSRYYLTISGFNILVPKGGSKNLVIKADLYPTIDSTDFDTETYTIRYASNGIRGIDGAGIDQYATDTTITRTPTIAADLSESATLTVGLNTSSPKKQEVMATAGANENEMDKLTVLTFDVKAEK